MLCQNNFLDIKDLPDYLRDMIGKNELYEDIYPFSLLSLEELEKNHIIEVLKKTNNNRQQTAKILNVSRQTLYRKLKKYKIRFKLS